MPRYKKQKEARKKKKSLLLIFYFILGIFLLGVIFQARKIINDSVWDGKERINLVVGRGEPFLFSLDPGEKTLTLVLPPSETFVQVPRGFGFYRLNAVYHLGELEGGGGKLLSQTFQEFLGIPIDGYLSPKGVNPPKDKEEARKFVKQWTGAWGFLKVWENRNSWEDFKTNLTIYDLFRLFWKTRAVRFDKIKFIDLAATSSFSDLILPEGSVVKTPDFQRLDGVMEGEFWEEEIKKENLKIEILNSTAVLGLGNQAARIITNLGGDVLRIGNTEQEYKNCEIKSTKKNLRTKTVVKVSKIFSCQVKEDNLTESRADVVLILGQDYAQKLLGSK